MGRKLGRGRGGGGEIEKNEEEGPLININFVFERSIIDKPEMKCITETEVGACGLVFPAIKYSFLSSSLFPAEKNRILLRRLV